MKQYEIAVIGAGKTGRGFIGRLLKESGKSFLLLDKNPELIQRLQAEGAFQVKFFGGVRKPLTVDGFEAVSADVPEIMGLFKPVKLVFISVGGNNLGEAGKWLAEVFEKRLSESLEECSFITCENASKPAEKLKKAFLDNLSEEDWHKAEQLFGFSEAAVFCTTLEAAGHPVDILSENYPRLPCDALPLKGNLPEIQGLLRIEGFENFLIRKIYTYNAASAAIAYLGRLKGYKVYSDAANDAEILRLLQDLYREVGNALCKAYGYDSEDQKEFAGFSLRKFRDRSIEDTIVRNAREPHRKLGCNERIIGPARLIQQYGGDSRPLEMTAAAALLYEDPEDVEWTRLKERLGAGGILEQLCRLEPESTLYRNIMKAYMELKKG